MQIHPGHDCATYPFSRFVKSLTCIDRLQNKYVFAAFTLIPNIERRQKVQSLYNVGLSFHASFGFRAVLQLCHPEQGQPLLQQCHEDFPIFPGRSLKTHPNFDFADAPLVQWEDCTEGETTLKCRTASRDGNA